MDRKAEEDLIKGIKENPLYAQMHPSILKDASWRYKKIDDSKSYSWRELNAIASGEQYRALFEQVYFSHYVHGVAISDFQFSSINETNPVFSLNICCSILNHLDAIFKLWFPDKYDNLEEYCKQEIGKQLLANMPIESLKAYLKTLDSSKDKV